MHTDLQVKPVPSHVGCLLSAVVLIVSFIAFLIPSLYLCFISKFDQQLALN